MVVRASVLILVQCIVRKNCVNNRHLFLNNLSKAGFLTTYPGIIRL